MHDADGAALIGADVSAASDAPAAPDHRTPGGRADSAGTPWAGRSFEQNAHSQDDGSAPPHLIAALARFRAGDGGKVDVVQAFATSRLLIPLLAELGDGGTEIGEHGLAVEKSQELSIVTVLGPDGRPVLPVFSSVETMRRWNPVARPVPADGVRVALAAADDGTDRVVLDPGSETEFGLRRAAVWAVAQSHDWRPASESEPMREAFARSIASELAVLAVVLVDGDPAARLVGPELVVELELVAGLERTELDAVLARLAQRWAADDVIATGADSLKVRLRAAS
ncbi:SseB family protein [Agromyces allii]|nr:SseB family protein [Agromyces allii]